MQQDWQRGGVELELASTALKLGGKWSVCQEADSEMEDER